MDMMKKEYIAPAIEVVEMDEICLVVGSLQDGGGMGGDPTTPPTEELSNNRRGQWGNLWAED